MLAKIRQIVHRDLINHRDDSHLLRTCHEKTTFSTVFLKILSVFRRPASCCISLSFRHRRADVGKETRLYGVFSKSRSATDQFFRAGNDAFDVFKPALSSLSPVMRRLVDRRCRSIKRTARQPIEAPTVKILCSKRLPTGAKHSPHVLERIIESSRPP